MVWTDSMRAKAAATRAEKKSRNNGNLVQDEASAALRRSLALSHGPGPDINMTNIGSSFDWEDSPLSEALNKASEMKRELDRVQAILLRRQNPPKKMWTCWTEENKKIVEIPRSVLSQCLKRGEDGKWKFRDDGRFVQINGVRTLQPAFCCNFLCYAIYQRNRVTQPAREAQSQAVR